MMVLGWSGKAKTCPPPGTGVGMAPEISVLTVGYGFSAAARAVLSSAKVAWTWRFGWVFRAAGRWATRWVGKLLAAER